ncbi:hypothetical protein FOZ63_022697 [Perkinsus olseni]|uniref:Uncharacterized protein n=1 Tax=Perkinsus olseni TaxID=32597 RepID=A0A7J6NHM5_PEROL|nr:hypothetical protein FOZ63_022697 [Perkinsus olseni]KAF4714167.1 hypothetical protein FOZ62_018750 [Perkinsus olseni]
MKFIVAAAMPLFVRAIEMDIFCRRMNEFECFIELDGTPNYAVAAHKGTEGFSSRSCDVKKEGPKVKRDAFTTVMAASLEKGCPFVLLLESPRNSEYAFVGDNLRIVNQLDGGVYNKFDKLSNLQVNAIAKEVAGLTFVSSEPHRFIQITKEGRILETGGESRRWKWTSVKGKYYLKANDGKTVAFIIPYYLVMVEKLNVILLRWTPEKGQDEYFQAPVQMAVPK